MRRNAILGTIGVLALALCASCGGDISGSVTNGQTGPFPPTFTPAEGPTGTATVAGSRTQTPVPTVTSTRGPQLTATPTPTPLPGGSVLMQMGSGSGVPGARITVDVRLVTGGIEVAGTENELEFTSAAPIVGCTRNEAIGKEATTFSFRPSGCTQGVDCESLKSLVLSFSDLSPIPDGAVLYSCQVQIADDAAAGTYPLSLSNVRASDAIGNTIPSIAADGEVIVSTSG